MLTSTDRGEGVCKMLTDILYDDDGEGMSKGGYHSYYRWSIKDTKMIRQQFESICLI